MLKWLKPYYYYLLTIIIDFFFINCELSLYSEFIKFKLCLIDHMNFKF